MLYKNSVANVAALKSLGYVEMNWLFTMIYITFSGFSRKFTSNLV